MLIWWHEIRVIRWKHRTMDEFIGIHHLDTNHWDTNNRITYYIIMYGICLKHIMSLLSMLWIQLFESDPESDPVHSAVLSKISEQSQDFIWRRYRTKQLILAEVLFTDNENDDMETSLGKREIKGNYNNNASCLV